MLSLLSKESLLELTSEELIALQWQLKWRKQARANQTPPKSDWAVWMLLAGRGFGKTRVGAEFIGEAAQFNPGTRWAVIAPTSSDVRDTCFEGDSGLVNVIPEQLIANYNRSLNEMVLKNGSRIKGFSSQEPERLRGPQFHGGWCDELAAWEYPEGTWDMYQFGLRLGKHPRTVITTTPKPIPLVRTLYDESKKLDGSVILTTGSTYDNRDNLAANFFKQIAVYEGTQLGRQEIYAELIDPEESGIIKRSWIQMWPAEKKLPHLEYVIQSYDTAFTEKTENDMTVCTTWGVFSLGASGDFGALLLDCWGERMQYPDLREKAQEEFNSMYGEQGRPPDVVLIEDKGSGITLRQDLQRAGIPVRPYNPGRADKTQRLHAVSYLFMNKRVYIPESNKRPGQFRSWAEPLLNQLCAFPLVLHDDYVDSVSQAMSLLRDQSWLTVDIEDDEQYYEPKSSRLNPYAI
jgi:predicted phage terminase large subunit-like protein